MAWGEKIGSPFARKPSETDAGWRADPERPGIERYWTGSGWDDEIAPRSTPTWKQARPAVVALLVAAALVFVVWRVQQPSEVECIEQRTEVLAGDRIVADDACFDR